MRLITILVLLFSASVNAETAKTKYFSVTIPDSLAIQTDNVRRIIAYNKKSPNVLPQLVIEYSNRFDQFSDIKTHINKTLNDAGNKKGLSKQKCIKNCEALYGGVEIKVGKTKMRQHFYLIKTKSFFAIINYGENDGMAAGQSFVFKIANEIVETAYNN